MKAAAKKHAPRNGRRRPDPFSSRGLVSYGSPFLFSFCNILSHYLRFCKKFLYRSSRKYAFPRLAGGWFSFFLRVLVKISTPMVTR